jgi:hypothetical protein
VHAKCVAARELRRRGYRGLLSATYVYPEERQPIIDAGCDVTYNYFTEAGVGLARDTAEALAPPASPLPAKESGAADSSTAKLG